MSAHPARNRILYLQLMKEDRPLSEPWLKEAGNNFLACLLSNNAADARRTCCRAAEDCPSTTYLPQTRAWLYVCVCVWWGGYKNTAIKITSARCACVGVHLTFTLVSRGGSIWDRPPCVTAMQNKQLPGNPFILPKPMWCRILTHSVFLSHTHTPHSVYLCPFSDYRDQAAGWKNKSTSGKGGFDGYGCRS